MYAEISESAKVLFIFAFENDGIRFDTNPEFSGAFNIWSETIHFINMKWNKRVYRSNILLQKGEL